jgi:hypothetical protein
MFERVSAANTWDNGNVGWGFVRVHLAERFRLRVAPCRSGPLRRTLPGWALSLRGLGRAMLVAFVFDMVMG